MNATGPATKYHRPVYCVNRKEAEEKVAKYVRKLSKDKLDKVAYTEWFHPKIAAQVLTTDKTYNLIVQHQKTLHRIQIHWDFE